MEWQNSVHAQPTQQKIKDPQLSSVESGVHCLRSAYFLNPSGLIYAPNGSVVRKEISPMKGSIDMSGDAGSYALENGEEPQRTNWRELEVQKWKTKAKNCPSNGFGVCCAILSIVPFARCQFSSCPFVYWGCL